MRGHQAWFLLGNSLDFQVGIGAPEEYRLELSVVPLVPLLGGWLYFLEKEKSIFPKSYRMPNGSHRDPQREQVGFLWWIGRPAGGTGWISRLSKLAISKEVDWGHSRDG